MAWNLWFLEKGVSVTLTLLLKKVMFKGKMSRKWWFSMQNVQKMVIFKAKCPKNIEFQGIFFFAFFAKNSSFADQYNIDIFEYSDPTNELIWDAFSTNTRSPISQRVINDWMNESKENSLNLFDDSYSTYF